jgi:hypothetical protein
MFAVVSTAAVTAEARPARPSSSRTTVSASRKEDAVARAIATMKALQKRLAGVINYSLISPPWPAPFTMTTTVSEPLTLNNDK